MLEIYYYCWSCVYSQTGRHQSVVRNGTILNFEFSSINNGGQSCISVQCSRQGCGSTLIFCGSGSTFSYQCRSRSGLTKFVKKLLYEELKKTKKSALKLKNRRAGPDILHKKILQLLPIFLPLFCFFPPKFLTTGSGSRMENECESMRVWIHSPGSHYSFPQYSTKKQRTQTYRKNLFTPVWNKT